MTSERTSIGVDVGGTTIKCALVPADGRLLHHLSIPTEATSGPEVVLTRIAEAIASVVSKVSRSERAAITGVGIGVPGVINNRGEISYPPNFPGWGVVPVAKRIAPLIAGAFEERTPPIAVENDANVAALAEARAGAGLGAPHFLYVTLGTGVGGCVISDGRIWRGETGGAGEVGHLSVDLNGRPCNCGSRGCVEAYIGQRYMTAIAAERLRETSHSTLHAMLADGAELQPSLIDRAASAGDTFALEFLEEMGEILGAALASALNLLDYRLVVAGGGMSRSETLLRATERSMRARVLRSIGDAAELRPARFLNDAGVIGAAMLAR